MQGRNPNDKGVSLSLVHVGEAKPNPSAPSRMPAIVAFDRKELALILSVYGRKVGQGEWRDYAMDFLRDRAVFSIYARVSERPPEMSRVLIASITTLCAADHDSDPRKIAAWTANKSPDGVTGMLANPDLRIFVAERDGAILGVGAVTRDGVIGLNYVAPEGRFSGVSKALLDRLEQTLLELGHLEGRLESTVTALSFYEGRGWQPDGPQASGRMVNGYPMRKTLIGTSLSGS